MNCLWVYWRKSDWNWKIPRNQGRSEFFRLNVQKFYEYFNAHQRLVPEAFISKIQETRVFAFRRHNMFIRQHRAQHARHPRGTSHWYKHSAKQHPKQVRVTFITNVKNSKISSLNSPRKYRGSRTSASLKVKGLLGRVWARDSKSKSCENLHVL